MPERNADRERFSLDLPFWLNGTLDKESARWMEAYMAAHPECAAEYRFTRDLGELLQAEESPIPEEVRLAQFMAKVQRSRPQRTWIARLVGWFSGSSQMPGYALAGVLAIMLGQAVVLGTLLVEKEDQYRSVPDVSECAPPSNLKLTFEPDAKQMDVILLLRQQNLRIVSGPSETGELWLLIESKEQADEVRSRLKASPSVLDVQDVPPSTNPRCKSGR